MKSTLFIGAVLAASQCVPEPSDPAGSKTATNGSEQAQSPDAGSPEDAAADTDLGAVTAEAARRLLQPGPAPFTVPTTEISWPQQRAMLRVPQGTKLEGDSDRARVHLGEGYNFAYSVAPTGQVELTAPGEGATVQAREDGALVWYGDGHWFFSGTFGGFDCWNDTKSKHDREDVEMMLASCRSIEQGTSSP